MAAIRSEGLCATELSNKEEIIALLDRRRRLIYDKPDVEELGKLLRLHELALWFLEDYQKTMKAPDWIGEPKWSQLKPLKLSVDERRRFLRGFYRLQIWANIFGNAIYQYCEEHLELPYDISHSPLDFFREYGADDGWATRNRFDCLAALVTKGPKFVYSILTKRNEEVLTCICDNIRPNIKHFECLMSLENPFNLHGSNLADPLHPQHLLYPADCYGTGNIQSFKNLIKTLPVEKRPGPCWLYGWSLPGHPFIINDAFLAHVLNTGLWHGPWKWGYAFWDLNRVAEWTVPDFRFAG
ncbi:uncharacterized protein DSM5745_01922 [Aspergillus mulundensis]|uniref:Uncharacterized protein n=1 Tax=Aspergillus mulundensis TaxID=1810919 RepID=A0A3D8SV06_9EURO|nr:hypothetical protein DSM5745_01922 [Aspergillus mulundensis]RDW90147.1 hypothetical protein DSM5745_01922 [Aspergillus mulundensis]